MERKIAIVGLGFAGLHTALAFGKEREIISFDIDHARVTELKNGFDCHNEFSSEIIKSSKVIFTDNPDDLKSTDFYVVVVPTPIKKSTEPDFSYLASASKIVGSMLKKNDIVVYESTVYPGATEEICLPILEETSHLKFPDDFAIGYSPERLNPGDEVHTFYNIPKIVSASDKESLSIIKREYQKIVKEVVVVSNIKTAEAVKIIENIQRDVNIALINEIAQFLYLLNVDITEVNRACKTKWNFASFTPGFVGGSCIGVVPYYLLFKAHELNFYPEIIAISRKVNESMVNFVADIISKSLIKRKSLCENRNVLIFGITFKENYSDVRHTKVIRLGRILEELNLSVFFYDPIADKAMTKKEYGIDLMSWDELPQASAIVLAVPHQEFINLSEESYAKKIIPEGFLLDIKGVLSPELGTKKSFEYMRLSYTNH